MSDNCSFSGVTYVCSEYYPTSKAVALRAEFHVRALRSSGLAVRIITSGPVRLDEEGSVIDGVGSGAASDSIGLAKRLFRELTLGFALARRVVQRRRDFLVITSPPFFTVVVVLLFAKLARIGYLLDVRDRYPQVLFSQGLLTPASFVGRLLIALERWMYTGARAVTTVSDALCLEISKDHGVRPVLVRNGFDDRIFLPWEKATSRPRPPVRIVMHGLFGRFFDAVTFRKIAEHCATNAQSHEFCVIGYGQKMDQIASFKLPNVKIFPAMAQVEIARMLSAADIGLSIHTNDKSMLGAFPVKVYEYLGAGLPVLVLPCGEAGKTVRERGFGGSFDNADWQEAADWLLEMINSYECRMRVAETVASSRKEFSRQAQAKRFAEVVKSTAFGEIL